MCSNYGMIMHSNMINELIRPLTCGHTHVYIYFFGWTEKKTEKEKRMNRKMLVSLVVIFGLYNIYSTFKVWSYFYFSPLDLRYFILVN